MGMARLSDLIATIAEAGGPPIASLNVIGRALREAGLVATGGRGAAGAQMTPSDLANVLLGLPALGEHTKAADTVARVGSLQLLNARDARDARSTHQIPGLLEYMCPGLGIARWDTLHTALSSLVSILSPDEVVSEKEVAFVRDASKPFNPFENWDVESDWGDPTPISLTIIFKRDGDYFSSDLLIEQKGGGVVRLDFRTSKDHHRPDDAGGAARGGIEATFRVKPLLVAAATRCIRDAAQTSHQ
ncbi:MAG: hypothetical protein ACK4NZ_10760 [Tsuneonella sp.]